jgi:hypothetical protein
MELTNLPTSWADFLEVWKPQLLLLIPAGAFEGLFEEKTPREFHQGGLVLARQCPGSPGICNPQETDLPGLPVS